jgi:hypothetical protein
MPQNFEFPLWTPHEKAKLYKRYTGEIPVELKGGEVITIEDVRYVLYGSFKWIETTSTESNDDQPMPGLIVEKKYVEIRTNSLKKFDSGDLVILPKTSPLSGLWIITDGARQDYAYTPKQVQTYQYLPLSNAG